MFGRRLYLNFNPSQQRLKSIELSIVANSSKIFRILRHQLFRLITLIYTEDVFMKY